MPFEYFLLFLVYFQNSHTLESTTSKEITVKGDAFMCSFNIQYEKDKCFKNSTVYCAPNQKIRRTAKNVALELNDGTKINIKKLKISRKPKKDRIIKCRIESVAITETTPALLKTTTQSPTSELPCPSDNINLQSRRDAEVLKSIGSAEECSKKCREKTTCNFWTWHRQKAGVWAFDCILMSGYGYTNSDNNVISGERSCNPEGTTTTITALPSTTSPIPTTGASSCPYTDKNPNCANWKDPHCTSGKWVDWMMTNCAKTCKCTGSQSCSPLPDSWGSDCSKYYLWACTDPRYPVIKEVCSTTCNYCDATTTTTAKPESKCKCGVKKRATRIFGGSETEVNEYPWMAALSMGCGGSVIADKWIVTAAHCFFDSFGQQDFTNANINQVTVTVGEHDKFTSSETTLTKKVAANLLIVHPQYEWCPTGNCLNDIALLRVPALDLKVYTPVCLPEEHATFDGKKAWVYGWGAGSPSRNKLQELEVTIVSDASAKQSYQKLAQPALQKLTDAQLATMIFAGGEKGKDACAGDSGGPLTHEKNNGQHELVGATSWGDGCAKKGLPGAYAEVSAYISWFDEEIKKNGGADNSC